MWSSKWNKSPYIVGMLLCKRSAWTSPTLCHVVKEIFACEDEVIKMFVALVRKIWTRCNIEIFEGQFAHPNTLNAYASAQVRLLSSASKVEHTTWKALKLGWFKLNWDAAICKHTGKRGAGVVVRDCEGKLIAVKCMVVPGCMDLLSAEAWAGVQAVNVVTQIIN